jgi:hypothetical protein
MPTIPLSKDIFDPILDIFKKMVTSFSGQLQSLSATNQKANLLKNVYQTYENDYNTDKDANDLSHAEKNYYQYTDVSGGSDISYNQLLTVRFATTAAKFRDNTVDKQTQYMREMYQLLKQYQVAKIFADRAEELRDKKINENQKLANTLSRYQGVVQTNERRVMYESQNLESHRTYRRVLLFFYFSILLLFLIFGSFFPEQQYKKFSVCLVLGLAIAFPLILNLLVKWVFLLADYISYWWSEIPHKDVYSEIAE